MESLRDDESNLVCNLERARRMHREVGHPSLKMMVDNIATGAAGETLGDWFRAFGAELIHMHFLDGDPWLHNVWGDGNTALAQQIQTMNDHHYTGYLVQEVADEHYFPDPMPPTAGIFGFWSGLWRTIDVIFRQMSPPVNKNQKRKR